MEFAPDGDLSKFDVEEIEIGAGWEGEDGTFLDAAIAAGYLDEDHGTLAVHDWSDYGGRLAGQRAVERKRSAARRAQAHKPANDQRTTAEAPHRFRKDSAGAPPDDLRTTDVRPTVDRWQTDKTEETEKTEERKSIAAPQNTAREPCPGENDAHSADSSASEVLSGPDGTMSAAPAPEAKRPDDTAYSEEFEAFWAAYPRKEEKRRAWRAWRARLRQRASPTAMTTAARHYATGCQGTERRFIKQAATFLGPDMPFTDWVSGVPPGCAISNGRGLSAAEMWGELIAETAEVET
jgi:hypothetical protein